MDFNNVQQVTTGVSVERKNFQWKIENFDMIRQSVQLVETQKFSFHAGDTIDMPTEWTFYLTGEKAGYVGVGLQLDDGRDDEDLTVFAKFIVEIRNSAGGQHYYHGNSGLQEFDWNDYHSLRKVISNKLNSPEVPLVSGVLNIELEFTLCTQYIEWSE